MVSVEQWKAHFKQLAHREFPNEDVYLVNQTGRGLGRNSYNRNVYKVRKPSSSQVNIVSPVAQTVNRARALMKKKPIKKRAQSKSVSRSVGRTPSRKGVAKKRKARRVSRAANTKRRRKTSIPSKKKRRFSKTFRRRVRKVTPICPCPPVLWTKGRRVKKKRATLKARKKKSRKSKFLSPRRRRR